MLLQINKQNPITWKGKYRASLTEQSVLPRAVNDHLNIWVAVGGTPESVLRAGHRVTCNLCDYRWQPGTIQTPLRILQKSI